MENLRIESVPFIFALLQKKFSVYSFNDIKFCNGKFADWVGPFHFRSAFKELFIISIFVNSVSPPPPSPFQKKK